MLNTALRLRELNVSVAPIIGHTKMFDAKVMASRGYTLKGLKDNLPSIEDLEYWFDNGNRRLAIICQNVVCLDFDLYPLYIKFKKEHPIFSYTWTVRTPRGAHLYYQVENPDVDKVKCDWNNVEIKYGGLAIISAGEGYNNIKTGMLNKLTMLKIRDALVLPIVSTPLASLTAPSLRSVALPYRGKSNDSANSFPVGESKGEARAESEANEVLITDYLISIGHTVKKVGKGWLTNCPFPDNHKHKDADPSFWIADNADKQLCNCYKESCASSKPMDYIDLYARINNIPNGEAYKIIHNVKPKETTKERRVRLREDRYQKREDKALAMVTGLMNRQK